MGGSQGTGPFTVERELARLGGDMDVGGEDPAMVKLVEVVDQHGNSFCYVSPEDCAGGDIAAAKARATRIAEALNRGEGHAAPAPYVDDHGNLHAPAGYGFVANGDGKCEMVPLVSIKLSPAP